MGPRRAVLSFPSTAGRVETSRNPISSRLDWNRRQTKRFSGAWWFVGATTGRRLVGRRNEFKMREPATDAMVRWANWPKEPIDSARVGHGNQDGARYEADGHRKWPLGR